MSDDGPVGKRLLYDDDEEKKEIHKNGISMLRKNNK